MQYQQQASSGWTYNSASTGRASRAYNLGLQMVNDDTWRTEMKCAFTGPQQLCIAVLILNILYIVLCEFRI